MIRNYSLNENKIDVWLCDGCTVSAKVDYFFSILSLTEQQRAQRFKFDLHQRRFIISHGFKRVVLSNYLNIDASLIQFYRGEKGKPFVQSKTVSVVNIEPQNLQFNLSHTEDITLLAITKKHELGIDIESMSRNADWKAISQRFFTQSEQRLLFSRPKSQQKIVFYQLWTRKEAYMKVLGSGLSLAPTEFSLTVPPQPAELIEHYSDNYKPTTEIVFKQIELADTFKSYCATLASTSAINDYSLYNYT